METKKLSIIIPCWNEKETIEKIIAKISGLTINNWQIEIIVVDDFSTDGTRDILKKYENGLKVIYHKQNLGKGSAVKSGIEVTKGDYILIQDADLEYDPREIPKLISILNIKEKTVVYGSRNIHHKKREGMIIPRLGVWFITLEFNILFGTKLTDIWTCYKLFPKDAGRFFSAGRFESELYFSAELIKHDYKIIEVGISHNPRPFGQGKKITYLDGLKGIWTIFLSRFSSRKIYD